MNWRRGLIRLWAVFTVLWIVVIAGVAIDKWQPDDWVSVGSETVTTPDGIQRKFPAGTPAEEIDKAREIQRPDAPKRFLSILKQAKNYIYLGVGVPLLVLGLGLSGWWVVTGFKSRT